MTLKSQFLQSVSRLFIVYICNVYITKKLFFFVNISSFFT